MTEPSFAPEDFGKTYQLSLSWEGMPEGAHVWLGGFWGNYTFGEGLAPGEFVNGQTYDVPAELVEMVEGYMSRPFSELYMESNNQLTVVE